MPDSDYYHLPLTIPPGVVREATPYSVKGRYIDSNMVRFWKGYPERWLGWRYSTQSSLGAPARGVLAWTTLDGTKCVAWGTYEKLWLLISGTLYDITPVGFIAGRVDSFWSDIAYGGVPDGNLSPATPYGYGPFGGGYGGSLAYGHATTWTLDKWGEDLIACPRGGTIYRWSAAGGTGIRAQPIAGAPSSCLAIFVSEVDRHLVALGAHNGVDDDPLRIAWPNQETLTDWTPVATSTAGDRRTEKGNQIIGSVPAKGTRLVFTDSSVYTFRYIGGGFVFSLERDAADCGLAGPHAGIEVNGIAQWMGEDGFYSYDGATRDLPCDVHRYVFDDINRFQMHKVFCGRNRAYGETIWFYPSANSSENNRYVAINADGWTIGELNRTSWLGDNVVTQTPIACDTSGAIYIHDIGTMDHLGAELPYRLSTGDLEFQNPNVAPGGGEQFWHIRKIIPDYDRERGTTGTHDLTIESRGYPMRSPATKGPYRYGDNQVVADHFAVRARGRTLRFKFSGAGDFRMGTLRGMVTPNGGSE